MSTAFAGSRAQYTNSPLPCPGVHLTGARWQLPRSIRKGSGIRPKTGPAHESATDGYLQLWSNSECVEERPRPGAQSSSASALRVCWSGAEWRVPCWQTDPIRERLPTLELLTSSQHIGLLAGSHRASRGHPNHLPSTRTRRRSSSAARTSVIACLSAATAWGSGGMSSPIGGST